MAKNYPLYILAGALFIFGLSIGFFAGRNLLKPASNDSQTAQQTEQSSTGTSNNLYSSQTASIRGVVTAVEGKRLSVKNLITGSTGKIQASTNLAIAKSFNAKPTSDLSAIELNKEALISLVMVDGGYQITAIEYVTPAPSLPPIPSGTKTP